MAHLPSALAEFQRGEPRLLYARYRSGEPGLYELVDGTAGRLREWVKAELLCPFEECPTPDFTTVNRSKSGRRDGFRHLVGNFNHAPESLFHLQAKVQLARHIRARHPEVVVVLEQASNPSRERVADIMITWPDGARVAVEVQYSPLTVDEWRTRHESYAAQGITDIWLFGHIGPQMRAEDAEVTFTAVQREIASEGTPVLWFNPVALAVATAITEVSWATEKWEVLATRWRGTIAAEPLTEFRLDRTQFSTPRITRLIDASIKYRQLLAAEEERKAETLAEARELALRTQANDVRRAAEAREWKAGRRAAMLRVWQQSSSGRAAAERFGGEVPHWLNINTRVDVQVPNQVWQWHLLTTYLDPIPELGWVRRDHAWRAFEAEFELRLSDAELKQLITVWFDALCKAGILHRTQERRRGQLVIKYWKRRKLRVRPAALSQLAMAQEPPSVVLNSSTLQLQQHAECKKCGGTVAPPFARTGYHMTCSPKYQGLG